MLLKITLKCFSLRVILDLLNQVVNVNAMRSFHHHVRHAWDVEVDAFLVNCKIELVRVWRCSVTMFERTNFLHCVCVLDSTGFPVLSWACMTRLSSHFTGFPVYQNNQVLLASTYQQSLVSRTCFLAPQVSPFDQQLDWVWDWVGLEDSARGVSPKDCWTSFPTGWCSTVEPDWSFPLVQLWSCFNEIFGGGRGDKYRLSYNISPVFNLSTSEI